MSKERKFNLLRGVIIGSYLEWKEKEELLKFVNELEEKEEVAENE